MKTLRLKIEIACTIIAVLSAATALWITLRPQHAVTVSYYSDQMSSENSLPMTIHNGSIFVHGMVNGEPALFKIDTGANVCVFDEDKLEKFSLRKNGAARKVKLAGNAVVTSYSLEAFIVDFPSIGIQAEIHQADCTSIVSGQDLDYDCLLGSDFLRAIGAHIDYSKELLVFQCKEVVTQRVDHAEQKAHP